MGLGAAGVEHRRRGHFCRIAVVEDGLGSAGDEAICLFFADPADGCVAAFGEKRGAMARVVCVRGEDVDKPLVEHALTPVPRGATEASGQGAGGDLNPCSMASCLDEPGVVGFVEPSESLWVGDNRDIAQRETVVDGFLEPHGDCVVWRLQEEIARPVERGVSPVLKAWDHLRGELDIGAFGQAECDIGLGEGLAEVIDGLADALSPVFVEAGIDVRGAGGGCDAVVDGDSRHLQRG